MISLKYLQKVAQQHTKLADESLHLISSENVMSHTARQMLLNDAGHRYNVDVYGNEGKKDWIFPNTHYLSHVEREAEKIACQLFDAAEANVKSLSGDNCVFNVLQSLTQSGDTVFRVSHCEGGHFATKPIGKRLGLEFVNLPFDKKTLRVDINRTADLFKKYQPKLILIDPSNILFDYPIRALKTICGDRCYLSFDGSQILGLIAGKAYPNPLAEGADDLHGTTHKTLPGPQKAMYLFPAASPVSFAIQNGLHPNVASNVHYHHIFALAVTLLEMQRFGTKYAHEVVLNAQTLGAELSKQGFELVGEALGYTMTHQLFIKIGSLEKTFASFKLLEAANINVNTMRLPFCDGYGLRIGVAEITRRGAKKTAIVQIAQYFKKLLLEKQSPKKIQKDIMHFMKQFSTIKYSFDR